MDLTSDINRRPPNGEYTHSYIKFSNVIGMRGTYETTDPINGGIFYSKADPSSKDGMAIASLTPPAENFSNQVLAIGEYETEEAEDIGCGGTVSWEGSYGTMKALLSCPDRFSPEARLIAVYKPDLKITIAKDTKGLQASFLVEGLGLGIGRSENNGQPIEFGSAPFRTTFETF